jgi:hypothetical protein
MGKELSAGFDIAGVLSEDTINKVFQLGYQIGLLPTHATTQFSHATGDHKLELYFLPPTLQFISMPNVDDPVRLHFSFLAQVPTMNAQGAGAITVFLTAVKLKEHDESDEEFNYVALDFKGVPATQYEFESEGWSPLPNASEHTFDTLDPAIVEDVAAPLAKSVLASGISKIPLTPRVPSNFGFFTFRMYVNENFTLPPDGTPYVLPRVLGAYVNVANDKRDPPATPPLDLREQIAPVPHEYAYTWAGADELKIAVPETLIKSKLEEAKAAKGLSPLPATITDGGDDYTITKLDTSLGPGHILVQGEADNVEFTLKIKLSIENDSLKSIIIDKDFDTPWYLDFAKVLLPPLGAAIVHAIELSIAKGLDSLGGKAGGLLEGVNIFASDLPGAQLAQLAQVHIHNNGSIDISPAGLVLDGQLETLLGDTEIARPFYVFGHLHSREFHRAGKGCPYLKRMKPENTILFLSPAKALSLGYNGCRFCYLDYDKATDGRVLLFFRAPDLDVAQQTIKASLRLSLTEPLSLSAGEEKPEFELDRTYPVEKAPDGYVYFSDTGLPDFLPGTWDLRVDAGQWTTDCQLPVKKWGKLSGKNTFVAFTVGLDTCEIAFGKQPAYPVP